jgi:hypothetical protein
LKLRDLKKTPWVCEVSEIFETAYWQRLGSVDPCGFEELLLNFQELAEVNPRMMGSPHPRLDGVWVFEGPSLARLPRVAFHYSIDDKAGKVTLWNCFLL